jgi:hypothetical protein
MNELAPAADRLACIDRDVALAAPEERLQTFVDRADTFGKLVRKGFFSTAALEQKLCDVARDHNFSEEDVADVIEAAIAIDNEPPLPNGRDDYGAQIAPTQIKITSLPPLTIDDWIARDLPQPDFLSGHWLSTTSRVLLSATTGLGKSNLGIA